MLAVIQSIDRVLKTVYRLDHSHWAENYVLAIKKRSEGVVVGSAGKKGALLIEQAEEDLFLGIYLHPSILHQLADFERWERWSREQLAAFSVASEEISHFNYVAHHSGRRSLTQVELELQGEVDKFVTAFFSIPPSARRPDTFDAIFDACFAGYSLVEGLSPEEQERYAFAIRQAKNFVKRNARLFNSADARAELFLVLRGFYHADPVEKLSRLSP